MNMEDVLTTVHGRSLTVSHVLEHIKAHGIFRNAIYELIELEVINLEEPPTWPKVSAIRNLGSDIGIVGGLGGMFYLEELLRGSDGMMTGF